MATENKNLPSKDEVLDNEAFLLQGLIEAANYKNDEKFRRKIDIRRGDRVLFSFRVRPLDEAEELACARKATPKIKNRNGVYVDGKTDVAQMRSYKIYTATIEEDKKRIWDNPAYKTQFGVITGVDMIDKVLRSGDKDVVLDVINEISGSGASNEAIDADEEPVEEPTLEEIAKN